ncbi:MAG TPA: RodZ domain-containing protein [Gammaproteobacteria bacterium]|nr:RodZ domain-containing protein [Gammaproteobacteria bacterium]
MADSEQRKAAADRPPAEPNVAPEARGSVAPQARPGSVAPEARNTVGPEARNTVGQLLTEARVAQDLSVEQIAAELRIEARQLVALEQDRFDRIGVPVFVKGYIKQYGARLGLDTSDLLAAYYKQGKLEDIDIRPMRAIKLHDEQRIRGWVVALIVVLALVGAFAVWWLNGASWSGLVPPAQPVERSEPAAGPAAGMPAPTPRASDAAAGAAQRVDVEASPPVPEPSPAAPVAQPKAAPAPGGTVTPSAAAAEPPADARAAAPLRPLEFAVDVDVTFEQDSWAEITDARGERLFYGLGSAGRRATLRGEPPLAVVLGNVDGVRISVEGADYEIPRPKQGNYARFTLQVDEE